MSTRRHNSTLRQPERGAESGAARRTRIVERVRAIPEGFVRTYGDIDPGAPRLVGRVLATVHEGLPWHRVVRADGSLDTGWRGPDLGPPAALTFLSLARAGPRVLVAGGFHLERRRPGVVALRAADGSLDPAWTTPRVCFDGAWAVRARAGRAWVATACAAPPCIVAVSGSTGRSIAWSPGVAAIGETGCVNDIAFAGNAVFFTGGFTAVGGVPRHGIAAADASTGRVLAAFASTSGRHLWALARRGNASTNALLAISGRIYVGGAFTRLAGVAAHGLVGLDERTGHAVATWHLPPSTEVYALAPSSGRILVGAQ